jgi:hypothetical protein
MPSGVITAAAIRTGPDLKARRGAGQECPPRPAISAQAISLFVILVVILVFILGH